MGVTLALDGDHLLALLERPQDDFIYLDPGLRYSMPRPAVVSGNYFKDVDGHMADVSGPGFVRFEGPTSGGNKHALTLRRLQLDCNDEIAVHLINASFLQLHDLVIEDAYTAVHHENAGSSGYSEHNVHNQITIKNCVNGVVYKQGTGNPSFKGQEWDGFEISGTTNPFTIGPGADCYTSTVRGQIWLDEGNPNATGMCVHGGSRGSYMRVDFENDAPLGWFLAGGDKSQLSIKSHFVNELTHWGIISGSGTPKWEFTYGVNPYDPYPWTRI